MATTRVPRTQSVETQAGEREAMPEAMYLQIHGDGSETMRMLELPPGPIRIGRGAHCEVRLVDSEIAEVQCILRLRGTTWHYQPVGPKGRVWIDGRAAEDPRAVSQGVPFRVGDHWLTLRSAQNAFHDWVAFDDPVPFVAEASTAAPTATLTEVAAESATTTASSPSTSPARHLPASTPDETEERLLRWQARLEQRERMLKDRQDERRWEARWKSAGESIRARSGTSAKAAPTNSPSPPAAPRRPTPSPVPTPTPTPRPLQTPPVSRIIEPRPSEPIRRVADPSPRPSAPRPSIRPLAEPSTVRVPIRPTIRVVPPSTPPAPPTSRGLVSLPSTPMDGSTTRIAPVDLPVSVPVEPETPVPLAEPIVVPPVSIVRVEEPQVLRSVFDSTAFEEILALAAVPEVEVEVEPESEVVEPEEFRSLIEVLEVPEGEAEAESGLVESEVEPVVARIEEIHEPTVVEFLGLAEPVEPEPEPEPLVIDTPAEPASVSVIDESPVTIEVSPPTGRIEASSWVEELTEDEADAFGDEVVEPSGPPVERFERFSPSRPEFSPTRWVEPAPMVEVPRAVEFPKSDLPSARAIFAAQGRRAQAARAVEPSVSSRRAKAEPTPTELQGPARWTLPLWLGWLPTVVATLAFGGVGLMLSFEWMAEAGSSNVGLKLALRPDTPGSPLIDPGQIPRGGWVFSTAPHMAAWAVALQRADDGENHSDDLRAMLAGARQTSPLAARSRFNVEADEASSTGAIAPDDFSEIGRTRDVVSLSSTGRRLREAGKVESSIRAYRTALEIALKAGRDGLEPPSFDENPQIRRYALPHEALVSLVVRSMGERGDWTIEQWTSVLPASATASWVASKALGKLQKKVEADALADLAIRQGEAPPSPGFDPAEHRAAAAEALAYRGRWTDSVEQYRQAIDQVDDDVTRRSWWFNLAELAHRMSDDTAQLRAIEAAKSPDLVDEITTRARKYQESMPALLAPGSRR